MFAVEVNHISKSYADKLVVDGLSFSVSPQEILGLIGPNGAGKTTSIRMMMDIIRPDSGSISILGEKLSEASKNRIGAGFKAAEDLHADVRQASGFWGDFQEFEEPLGFING